MAKVSQRAEIGKMAPNSRKRRDWSDWQRWPEPP